LPRVEPLAIMALACMASCSCEAWLAGLVVVVVVFVAIESSSSVKSGSSGSTIFVISL